VQLLVSAITHSGDGYRTPERSMSRQASFSAALVSCIAIPLVMYSASAVYVLPNLERATAKQCLEHDWPADKHQAHMAWCAANGYKS